MLDLSNLASFVFESSISLPGALTLPGEAPGPLFGELPGGGRE